MPPSQTFMQKRGQVLNQHLWKQHHILIRSQELPPFEFKAIEDADITYPSDGATVPTAFAISWACWIYLYDRTIARPQGCR
jgi:hypothetical protein